MSQPNVLLICTDHWPASLLGAAGHQGILSPTLDELAHSGVRFANAYSECPVCVPARRSLMTGTSPRTHGDRQMRADPMPDPRRYPTLAQCFREAGYQAYAVGKLHVHPPRDRIGFDDVILAEEGRIQTGVVDDYEIYLAEQGLAGQQFAHAMGNNVYLARPWHLPEHTHVTNWATRQMVRTIRRRDPNRPGFWYLSYTHPHPPLAPLQPYLDMYDPAELPLPHEGAWASREDALPSPLRRRQQRRERVGAHGGDRPIRLARQAFYALCTHIDHQLRLVIGTLREEGILENTIICFTSDHGEMLGNHGLWGKRLMYEDSANVPMLLLGPRGDERVAVDQVDDRLVALRDVMPTLLDLAGLPIPESVDGVSMLSRDRRERLYGEVGEIEHDLSGTRMVRDHRYKLIYYPHGNRVQLFDLEADPLETRDLADDADHASVRSRLSGWLVEELYGDDESLVQAGQLVGRADPGAGPVDWRALHGQRGLHYPPPSPR